MGPSGRGSLEADRGRGEDGSGGERSVSTPGRAIAIGVVVLIAAAIAGLLVGPAPIGAVTGVGLAYGLGRSSLGGRTATGLVLAGVAVASFLTALQTFLQQQRSDTLRQVYTWILGRLGTAGWDDVGIALPSVLIAV